MCTYFKTKTDVAQNLIDDFFLTLTVRGPFHKKLISEALYAGLTERAEAATISYSVTSNFLQYMYFVPVTKNHQNMPSRCSVHEFYITDIFLQILIMVTEQLY